MASAILTTHYTDQRRSIKSGYTGLDDLYEPTPRINSEGQTVIANKYNMNIDDYMSYYSFKNTFALAMNEGFRSWTKFGLTAFLEYDMRKFSLPGEIPGLSERHSENVLWVGGVLTKEKGKHLRDRAAGEGDITGEDGFKLEGEITTMLNLFGKDVSAKAKAHIKSIRPSFFERNFSSPFSQFETIVNYRVM